MAALCGTQEGDGTLQASPVVGGIYTIPLTRQIVPITKVGRRVHYKSAYWGTLHVGTPSVAFKMVFDTGSGHLILPSTYCHSSTCRVHQRYRRLATTTAVDIDGDGRQVASDAPRDQITIAFGTGEVRGVFVEDTVCLVGKRVGTQASDECLRMRMIAATEMSEEPFKAFDFDGVLGLGLASLSHAKEFSFVQSVGSALMGGEQTFAFYLSEPIEGPSEITFGGWDPGRLAGPLSWVQVAESELGHWMLRIESIRVGGVPIDFCQKDCKAVVDTGTPLLAVPSAAFTELFDLLQGTSRDNDCNNMAEIHIDFGSITLKLGPKDYGVRPGSTTDENGMLTTRQCKPMMMSMRPLPQLGAKVLILGEPIMRKYYTVFDASARRVGFGLASRPAVE